MADTTDEGITALLDEAVAAFEACRFAEANERCELILAEAKTLRKDDPRVLRAALMVTAIYDDELSESDAAGYLHAAKRSLALHKAAFGDEHAELVWPHIRMAQAFMASRRNEDGERHYLRAVAIAERASEEHPQLLDAALEHLGKVYFDAKRFSEAETVYRRWFEDAKRRFVVAPTSRLVFTMTYAANSLRRVLEVENKLAEEEVVCRTVVAILSDPELVEQPWTNIGAESEVLANGGNSAADLSRTIEGQRYHWLWLLAKSLLRRGAYAEANTLLEQYLSWLDEEREYFHRALAAVAPENREIAKRLRQVTERVGPLRDRAEVLRGLGRPLEADQLDTEADELRRENVKLLMQLKEYARHQKGGSGEQPTIP
jgi:tetratricopeptide (TPR) repeat protein